MGSCCITKNLEGWDGAGGQGRFKREETYVYLWLIHIVVWQKPIQYCKAIILCLKKKFLMTRKTVEGTNRKWTKAVFNFCRKS